jgi:hypothetical protein
LSYSSKVRGEVPEYSALFTFSAAHWDKKLEIALLVKRPQKNLSFGQEGFLVCLSLLEVTEPIFVE